MKLITLILLLFLCVGPLVNAQKNETPSPLKVGYSVGISGVTLEKMIYARSIGIDYIEISMSSLVDSERNFTLSDSVIFEQIKKTKKIVDNAGIKIWSIHMPYGKNVDISLPNEEERKKVVTMHKKIIQFCELLHPKIFLFHPSWYLGLNERELRKSQMIKSAIELNKQVRQINGTMVIENMLGPQLNVTNQQRERPLCRTVEETVEIMNRLPDNIYSAIDMNHIKNPELLIRAMGKRLKSVHISDGNGEQENHYSPCSGKGKNNWGKILTALNEVGYRGPFMYESAFSDLKELTDCYNALYQRVFIKKMSDEVHTTKVDSVLTAKTFPLLSLLKAFLNTNSIVQRNASFNGIRSIYQSRFEKTILHCSTVSCYADSLKWKPDEISAVGNALIELYQSNQILGQKITWLKKEGYYALFESAADTSLLRNAWNREAEGLNRIFDVYLKGKKPRYYQIDSISYKPGNVAFKQLMQNALTKLANSHNSQSFFDLSLNAAIQTLKLNGRDEAVRFEPLHEGLNGLPYSKIKNTNWDNYTYSLILVPGKGPEVQNLKLDSDAIKRCNDAAVRFRKGLAPFIVVSGGNVHPFQTPHNEAVEMKKYLVEQCKIAEDVVFIEPYARHTTTNLRNVNRMIFKWGIPTTKPVLIVSDKSQSSYITDRMAKTARRDLGYLPYEKLKSLTEQDTEFYPAWNSLQVDCFDPLDPN